MIKLSLKIVITMPVPKKVKLVPSVIDWSQRLPKKH